jgi:serine/threonine protein kinase
MGAIYAETNCGFAWNTVGVDRCKTFIIVITQKYNNLLNCCFQSKQFFLFSTVSGPLTESQIALMSKETLQGLAYLHSRGKMHRDVKASVIRFFFLFITLNRFIKMA